MMFSVYIPKDDFYSERKYILDAILDDFLGIKFKLHLLNNIENVIIEYNNRKLIIKNVFFKLMRSVYLTPKSLPPLPLKMVNISELNLPESVVIKKQFPVIYGKSLKDGKWIQYRNNTIVIGIDIFGSCFFMLTRYEELVKKNIRDKHNRFPASASIAYQQSFLDRPIVNEYVEILWYLIKRLWPLVERKKRQFKIMPTHDVDCLLKWPNVFRLVRNTGKAVLKEKNLSKSIHMIKDYIKLKYGKIRDPYDTFDYLMNFSEKNGLISKFFFLVGGKTKFDNFYLFHPYLYKIIDRINQRGHEIGFHGSYASYNNFKMLQRELKTLQNISPQKIFSGRQHFLRWENPITWRFYEQAGLFYDFTLNFHEHEGFRCGTCYDYPVYDLIKRKKLNLREIPLIIMDGNLKDYQKLSLEEAINRALMLKQRVRKYNGLFTILWHNSSFDKYDGWEEWKRIYEIMVTY